MSKTAFKQTVIYKAVIRWPVDDVYRSPMYASVDDSGLTFEALSIDDLKKSMSKAYADMRVKKIIGVRRWGFGHWVHLDDHLREDTSNCYASPESANIYLDLAKDKIIEALREMESGRATFIR